MKKDGSANRDYNRALLLFRRQGAGPEATAALATALARNAHVPACLPGRKRLSKKMPDYIGYGDESEAIDDAAAAKVVWRKTTGALRWLQAQLAER